MVIARQIREKLAGTPTGTVLTTKDFDIEMQYQSALVKALNRLIQQGSLQKISKGRYYIPKKTVFGTLRPADSELVKDLLECKGAIVGYITGTTAFASMGLTTQVSSSILVGTNKYRRPLTRNGVKISFLQQDNPITQQNIPLLRLLDALRLMKMIPAASPDECIKNIGNRVKALSANEQAELLQLSLRYAPYVRASLGAIAENIGIATDMLRRTLNGVTYYKLPISEEALPNKKNWNIL